MQYIEFGKLGFKVSRYGLGCMRLPLAIQADGSVVDHQIDEVKAIEMIRHAIDQGVNYVDTANGYHGGNSKYVLGKALTEGYREKVKVATKLPPWDVQTADDFERLLDNHLEALQTDCIDFYLLHAMNKELWVKLRDLGVLDFLDESIKKGKIKYPAFSFHGELEDFKEIIDAYDWAMCQIQLNILDTDIQAGLEGLRYAAAKGIAVVIMEPLKGGRLVQNIPQDILEVWDTAKHKRSPQAWAFHWLANMPEVTVILSGASTLEQLKDSLEIFEDATVGCLNKDEEALVDQVKKLYESKIKVGCTGCNYCVPCPVKVEIPHIFSLYNQASMYDELAVNQKRYEKLVSGEKSANQCISCGKCMKVCPQSINIIKKLQEAHSYFKKA